MIGASIETPRELWASSLREVKKRIRPLFAQERAALNAGLFDERRKTGWMRAEAAGDPGPWRQQAVLGRDRWDADALRDLVRDYATAHLADENAVLVIDETGFLKQGKASCGVARQYTGSAGKITNCQIGVCCLRVASRLCLHRSGALFPEGLDRRSGSPECHIRAGRRRLFDKASAGSRDDRARSCSWRAVPLGCGR
jgi:SRSO17 transposase